MLNPVSYASSSADPQTAPCLMMGMMGSQNRNRKLEISRAPTKAKSREPAYSQALNQNRIDRQGSRIQTVRRLRWMMFRVEMAREVRGREGIGIGFVKKQCFQF